MSKEERITVRLTDIEKLQLQVMAIREKVSLSELIRRKVLV